MINIVAYTFASIFLIEAILIVIFIAHYLYKRKKEEPIIFDFEQLENGEFKITLENGVVIVGDYDNWFINNEQVEEQDRIDSFNDTLDIVLGIVEAEENESK